MVSGLDKIGTPPEVQGAGFIQTLKDKANRLYTEGVDRYHPLSQVARQGGEEQAMRNAMTQHYGAASTGDFHVDHELAPILKSANADDLRAYTVAQRDAELAGRDIKGSDAGAARGILDGLKAKYGGDLAPLEGAAQKLYAYQDNLVKTYLVDSGVISQEAYAAMRAKNQRYVPFQRIMDAVDGHLGIAPTKAVGSVGSQNVIKGITGSDRQIHDPLQSIVENTYKIVRLGRRNKVASVIAGLSDTLPDVVRPLKQGETGNPATTINVLENGAKRSYAVPHDVAEAARGLNEEAVPTILKILSLPTKALRATATGYNPEFQAPNVVRDLQSAFVNVGLNPLRFVSGMAHLIKKDAMYQEFLKAGGKTSSVSLDRGTLAKRVTELTSPAGVDLKSFKNPLNVLRMIGEASEQPTRIAMFEQTLGTGLKGGLSREEAAVRAANAAQEGTVNFARRGAKTAAVNGLVAFLNARVQGTDQLIRSVKKNPAGTLTRLALISQAPAVLSYLYNRQFPSYNDPRVVSDYDKQKNFIVMLSDTPIDALGGAQFIKIPKGDVGQFANPTEAFLAHLDGHGENTAIADIAKAFGSLAPASNLGDIIPTAIRPVVENAANHSFFTGREIVPDYKKNYPAASQYDSQTAPIYKLAGQYLNQSPAKLQNLVSGYGTGFEKLGAQALSPFAVNGDPDTGVPETRARAGNQPHPRAATLPRRREEDAGGAGRRRPETGDEHRVPDSGHPDRHESRRHPPRVRYGPDREAAAPIRFGGTREEGWPQSDGESGGGGDDPDGAADRRAATTGGDQGEDAGEVARRHRRGGRHALLHQSERQQRHGGSRAVRRAVHRHREVRQGEGEAHGGAAGVQHCRSRQRQESGHLSQARRGRAGGGLRRPRGTTQRREGAVHRRAGRIARSRHVRAETRTRARAERVGRPIRLGRRPPVGLSRRSARGSRARRPRRIGLPTRSARALVRVSARTWRDRLPRAERRDKPTGGRDPQEAETDPQQPCNIGRHGCHRRGTRGRIDRSTGSHPRKSCKQAGHWGHKSVPETSHIGGGETPAAFGTLTESARERCRPRRWRRHRRPDPQVRGQVNPLGDFP